MFKSSIDTIEEFKNVLDKLSPEHYSYPCGELSGASIGKHTRHIIELYQCLLQGYEQGEVCYDSRVRNREIELHVDRAVSELNSIQQMLERPDRKLKIIYGLNEDSYAVESNYFREVMYNLEHAIHHHALIKIGINCLTEIQLPETFGVAPATIEYRKLCAQ